MLKLSTGNWLLMTSSVLKGISGAISGDLPFIERHVWFTKLPFKPVFHQLFLRYYYWLSGKLNAKKLQWCTLLHGVYTVQYMYNITPSLPGAQNLRQGVVMKNPGFTDGFRQFCGYQYFCYEILYYLVSSYFPFFKSFKLKSA